MNRKVAFAFFLSLLVIIGYNYFMAQQYPPPSQEVLPGPVQETPFEQKEQILPSPVVPQAQEPKRKTVLASRIAAGAKDIIVETDLVRLVITSSGARIKSCQLKGYAEEKITAKSVQEQFNQIEQAIASASGETKESFLREKRKLIILREKIEGHPAMAELISLAAAVDADFSPAILLPDNEKLTRAINTALYRCPQDYLTLSQARPQGQLEFSYFDIDGRRLKKVFTFSNSSYIIGLDIKFQGWEKTDLPAGHFLLYNGPDVGLPLAQRGRRTYGYQGPITYFQNAQQGWVMKEKYGRQENSIFVRRRHTGKIGWTGLENKYFLSALIPAQPLEAAVVERNKAGEQKVALVVPRKEPAQYSFQLYLGPKREERLKQAGATLEKAIDYGFFGPIARIMYQILVFFYRWTHNFGWAIVLLCIITKAVFYPLTHRGFESMQKMQSQMQVIQPEMNELRARLKDNPQKLNKEIMELYRKRGVNPLASCQSGCLPMLLQMPVFFALYAVLYNAIELRGAPFFGWIVDLSAKDPYFVLPVLMGISMFAQQKLTGMGGAGGAQQEQAKMMAWLMPIFLTWIFASLPSGVVLYWLTFNIATAMQQLAIRKKQQK